MRVRIHSSAEVSLEADIGYGTSIWNNCQIRGAVIIGRDCIIGKDVYIDNGVIIGDNVKIQNGVSLYEGVELGDGVFCGPHCVFTNDKHPRAVNLDGTLKGANDWIVSKTIIRKGASIGAGAVIVCGIVIGEWAMIGAGAVVTKDVPSFGLVYGNPARLVGYVNAEGQITKRIKNGQAN